MESLTLGNGKTDGETGGTTGGGGTDGESDGGTTGGGTTRGGLGNNVKTYYEDYHNKTEIVTERIA